MAARGTKVIGGAKNFWLYSEADGYDLTHPESPDSMPIQRRLSLNTTTGRVTIDPAKTALVLIDFQNYFISPALGFREDSSSMMAINRLLEFVIPACRQVNIPLVWMGWGFGDEDLEDIPPAVINGFSVDTSPEDPTTMWVVGHEMNELEGEDGDWINGGRIMMRNQWNTNFNKELMMVFDDTDLWVEKKRPSGFWGTNGADLEEDLAGDGIKTLLFAGEHNDYGVGASIQDAFAKGYDCLLLSDGCGDTGSEVCKQAMEEYCESAWGFVLRCKDLADGVDNMY
jgi:nicotinamidase-related amidase